jgi:superfamily II DNA or RNA helicase
MNVLLSILETTMLAIGLSTKDLITLFKNKNYENCTQMKIIAFIFEIVCALEKSETLGQEVQLYAHVDMEVKDKKGFPTEDTGIDLMSKDMTYYGQVKNYKAGSYVQAEHIKQSALNFYHGLYKDPENPPKVLEFLTPTEVKLSYGKLKFDFIKHNFIDMDVVEKWLKAADVYQLPPPSEQKDFKLRRCQKEALAIIKEKYNKKENVYIEIVCGGGKSDMMCYFLKHIKPEAKVLILVPLLILLEQWSDTLTRWNLPHSLCGTGYDVDISERIVVCVYNSFDKTTKGKYDYFIVDESHHMERKEVKVVDSKKALKPEGESDDETSDDEEPIEEVEELFIAEDKKDIKYINKIIEAMKITPSICLSATMRTNPDYRYTIEDGIKDGVITDYQTIVAVFSTSNYTNSLIDYIANNPKFSKKLVYTNSIESCKKFTKALNDKGMSASFITCDIKKKDRQKILEDFRSGKIGTIVSVNTLGEGVNIPEADTCIFAEPRSSHFSIIQAAMRVMRSHIGKCISYVVLPAVKNNEVKEISKFIKAFVNRDNRIKNIISGGVVSHRLIVEAAEEEIKVEEADFVWEKIYKTVDGFMGNYLVYKEYYSSNNKPPKKRKLYMDVDLYGWIQRQTHDFRRGILSEERIKLMDAVNKNWRPKHNMMTFKEKASLAKEYYKEFKKFPSWRKEYKGVKIGEWLSSKRRKYYENKMNDKEIMLLDEIDPSWKIGFVSKFDEYLSILKEYHKIYNKFPKYNEFYLDVNLGVWLHVQRKRYTRNVMSEDHRKSLDEIDVKWKAKVLTFEEKVLILKKFYIKYRKFPVQTDEFMDVMIGTWYNTQRQSFKNDKMSLKRIKMLDDISPSWRENLEQNSETV